MNFLTLGIVWVSAHRIEDGSMQVGDMTAFITYAMMIVMAFLMLTAMSIMLPRAAVAAERIDEVLRTEPSVTDNENPEVLNEYTGVIQFSHVNFRYPNAEEDVLNDIDFVAEPGKTTAIIGSTGCGKSTLLNILACLDSATKGSIKFNNLELTKLNSNKLNDFRAHEIGFIFQHYYLLNDLTVKENILLSNDITKTNKDIDELLVDLELSGLENKYPYELSGGQCQRVGIARALAKNPRFILGDEPTGNLDKLNSRNVMRVLKKISKDRLVVIVSHNLLEADEYADRIIELEDGKIISDRIKSKKNN